MFIIDSSLFFFRGNYFATARFLRPVFAFGAGEADRDAAGAGLAERLTLAAFLARVDFFLTSLGLGLADRERATAGFRLLETKTLGLPTMEILGINSKLL